MALKFKIKHENLFGKYVARYERIPNYKKVLNSMIKFSEMYQPLRKGRWQVDIFGQINALNEWRKYQRAQIYMNKKDLISTVDSAQGKKIVVTTRGHKIFYEDYPLAKLRRKPWDGRWTIISYDFPEKIRTKRNFFRKKISNLGFGSPQQSLFVSPLPLEQGIGELVTGEGFEDFVWITRAKRVLGIKNSEVARRSWNLNELNELYKALLKTLPQVKKSKGKDLSKWQKYFLALNAADPYLPNELLPKNWSGTECEKEFKKIDPLRFLKSLFS